MTVVAARPIGRVRFFFRRHSEAYQTLAAKADAFAFELNAVAKRAEERGEDISWVEEANQLLDRATAALSRERGRGITLNQAWWSFMSSQRKVIFGLTRPELLARAHALRMETDEKLRGWRWRASAKLFDDFDRVAGTHASGGEEVLRHLLDAAASVLDGQTQNEYRNLSALRARVLTLTAMTTSTVAVTLARALVDPLEVAAATDLGWGVLSWVALFGLLGGCISAFQPLREKAQERFVQQLVSWHLTVVRPVLGAAGALATYALLNAVDVVDLETRGNVIGVAVAAGFSERLLISSVARVSSAVQASDDATGRGGASA